MQVETRIIKVHSIRRGASISGPAGSRKPLEEPWRELRLDRGITGFDKPTYQRHVDQEFLDSNGVVYYGKPYNFNTKYVVDAEEHDIIGSVITLASGSKVHIDMTAKSVALMCNRR